MYKQLLNNLPNPNVDKHCGFITPKNCLSLFKQYNVPISPDILKIDIDGYDLEVLRELLKEYKPKIIVAEINEKIPPPIHFEVKFNENYGWDTSHFFGFSLQDGFNVLTPLNYHIIRIIEGNNIVAIHNDYFDSEHIINKLKCDIKTMYQTEYGNSMLQHFPWNKDINHWLTIKNPIELKNDIFNYFTTERKMRGLSNLGKPINPDAFELYISSKIQ